ncbi:zinc finger fyve/phd-type [Holotrichia oblita]|uniref:Zinc finger fyve/phd-type n=1 Tax=Holotrichia oblita TaxID=644536 RepID=A0ACB9TX23_HOLOL|nr:zinc finger fyve/phd-type [Holotrichia oblita]
MDEKGCRLMLHHQQRVLAEKVFKRVQLIGSEYAENVTIVGCANALCQVIPPMILFKGQRLKPVYSDGLPTGAIAHMTPKGSMTTEVFLKWLEHFASKKRDDTDAEAEREENWYSEDEIPLADLIKKGVQNNSFSKVLVTPDMTPVKTTKRKKALNYRAQNVKKAMFTDIFNSFGQKKSTSIRKSSALPSTGKPTATEVWMCSVCNSDYVADMSSCCLCGTWVHEECVGLTVHNTEDFVCPECLL